MATTVKKAIRKPVGEVPRNVVSRPNVANSRAAVSSLEQSAYSMPLEKLRDRSNTVMRQQNWEERKETEYEPVIAVFAKRHPELRKYHDHNSTQIALELETVEGKGPMQTAGRIEPNMWDWEMAYDRAQAKGSLRLDEAIVRQQRIEAVERQTDPRGFTEQDLYNMPEAQLRALANGVFDQLGPQ